MPGRLLEKAEVLAALPLLVYSAVLVVRVCTGGTGRIGGDVVAAAYVLAAASFAIGVLAFIAHQRATRSRFALGAHLIAAVAIAAWLALHLSGIMYSHESLYPVSQVSNQSFRPIATQGSLSTCGRWLTAA